MTEFYSFLEHLLYDHECVIIPQFGGFVVNAEDFSFNEKEGKISKWWRRFLTGRTPELREVSEDE